MDYSILTWINNTFGNCKFFAVVSRLLSFIGSKWGMIALVAILLIFKKTRKIGLTMGISLLLGFLIGNLFLKNVIARPRPYTLYPDITLYVPRLHSYSFPSGHAASSFVAAVALFQFYKKPGIAAITLATLIAFSRIYLFMHWTTDVLAGALFGTLIAFCTVKLLGFIEQQYFTQSKSLHNQ